MYKPKKRGVSMTPQHLAKRLFTRRRATAGKHAMENSSKKQGSLSAIITALQSVTAKKFRLQVFLQLFVEADDPRIRGRYGVACEIVACALLETVATAIVQTTSTQITLKRKSLRAVFADLAGKVLSLKSERNQWNQLTRIYRVGVTNAADRGLDMWANFGPAIQVKHIILDEKVAESIVDQVESDRILVVCRDVDAAVIRAITKQIGWGRRVCGIIVESDLVKWYERCLRGRFATELAKPLMTRLLSGFQSEFPQISQTAAFMQERGYDKMKPVAPWRTETDSKLAPTTR